MHRVLPGLLALFSAGCMEIWQYDPEVWVDVLYPPDSAWSLSPVSVVIAGAQQDSGRALRMFPFVFRKEPPQPEIHPARLSLWVDGEKRLEFPDTALVHRVKLSLSEGWHTLQVRAGTTASRIRHVRVLAPDVMPVRFHPAGDNTALPRTIGLSTAVDTILGTPPLQVRFFFDQKDLLWVIAHPGETLRIQAPQGLHVREFPQGLYVIASQDHAAQAYWIHQKGITALQFPAGVGTPIPSYEAVCDRSSVMTIQSPGGPFASLFLIFLPDGVRDTLLSSASTLGLLTCENGEAGIVAVDIRKHTPFRLPALAPGMLLYVEGRDTLLFAGGIWWRAAGTWYFIAPPEVSRLELSCFAGWEKTTVPKILYEEDGMRMRPLTCIPSELRFRILGLRRILVEDHAYTWTLQKEAKP